MPSLRHHRETGGFGHLAACALAALELGVQMFNEVTGDMWSIDADAYCITTNGFVKKNGRAVMGAGCAKEAAKRWPTLPLTVGWHLTNIGNQFSDLGDWDGRFNLLMFPVKHNWWEKADLDLIVESAKYLMAWIDVMELKKVILPRPGCGNGHLNWEDVKKVLEPILDERVWVVSK